MSLEYRTDNAQAQKSVRTVTSPATPEELEELAKGTLYKGPGAYMQSNYTVRLINLRERKAREAEEKVNKEENRNAK